MKPSRILSAFHRDVTDNTHTNMSSTAGQAFPNGSQPAHPAAGPPNRASFTFPFLSAWRPCKWKLSLSLSIQGRPHVPMPPATTCVNMHLFPYPCSIKLSSSVYPPSIPRLGAGLAAWAGLALLVFPLLRTKQKKTTVSIVKNNSTQGQGSADLTSGALLQVTLRALPVLFFVR